MQVHMGSNRTSINAGFLSIFAIVAFVVVTSSATSLTMDHSSAVLIRVDQSGNGDFKKIQDAIDSVPSHNTQLYYIWVKPGIYRFGVF